MARLAPLTPEQLGDDQRLLYDAIVTGPRAGTGLVDDLGTLRGPFDPLLRTPAIGDAVQQLGAVLRYGGSLPDDVRETAILLAAAQWNCRFELEVHSRIAEKAGVDPAVIDAIRDGAQLPLEPGAAMRLVQEAAQELFTTRRLADATFESLRTTLGEAQTVELLVVLGYYSLLAMILEGCEVQ